MAGTARSGKAKVGSKRKPKIANPKKAAFLAAFSLVGNIGKACEIAKTTRDNVRYWRKEEAFEAALQAAGEDASDHLEEEARRRAYEGVVEPVFGSLGGQQGSGEIGTIRKYSDTLLIFLLKGARPQKYRERYEAPPQKPSDGEPGGVTAFDSELAKVFRASAPR